MFAQTATTGSIEGTVIDYRSGYGWPNIKVVATSDALLRQVTAHTNDEGVYRLGNLPPGSYTLTFLNGDDVVATRDNVVVEARRTTFADVTASNSSPQE